MTNIDAFDMTISQFNAEVELGKWVKPRDLLKWLRSQDVKVAETGIYYWMTKKTDPLPGIKVGGPDGHVWLRKTWVNEWLDKQDWAKEVGRL